MDGCVGFRHRAGIDFSSNDYLGLGASAELRAAVAEALARGVAVGAGGSRLLRGNDLEHEALEADAARFFGAETALYFGGGFVANYAIFSTLPERGDLIVHDELIHASVHDGMRASKAEHIAARHNDPQSFDDALAAWRERGNLGTAWIAVESLYSMDGDKAPLETLRKLRIAAVRFWSSTKLTQQACSAKTAAVSARISKAAAMSYRCILAARRWARWAPLCWRRK